VIAEYEARCVEIERLEAKLTSEQEQLTSEQTEIEKLKVRFFQIHFKKFEFRIVI
jgi:hypothetical protein